MPYNQILPEEPESGEVQNTINRFGTSNPETVYPPEKYLGKSVDGEPSEEQLQQQTDDTLAFLQASAEKSRGISSEPSPSPSISDEELQARRSEVAAHKKTYSGWDFLVDRKQADSVMQSAFRFVDQTFVNPIKDDDSFVLTEEVYDKYTKDIPRVFHHEFESAGSLTEVKQRAADIKWRLGMEERLGKEGIGGSVARFAGVMFDPAFLVLMAATEGVASVTLGNIIKTTGAYKGVGAWGKRLMEAEGTAGATYAGLTHIGRTGLRVGTGMAGVTGVAAAESGIVSIDDIPTAFGHGFAFGAGIGTIGLGWGNLVKRVKVPKEAHLMTERQFENSNHSGSHRSHVIKSIEEGGESTQVVADYFVKERGLPEGNRPVTDAVIKNRGEEYYKLLESEHAFRTLDIGKKVRPEAWQEYTIRNYGRMQEQTALTFKEAFEAQNKIWKARKELKEAVKLEKDLAVKLTESKTPQGTEQLKEILKKKYAAKQRVKAAKRKVKAAERSVQKFDVELDALIKDIKSNPQKYRRLFKDSFKTQMNPFGKRVKGGYAPEIRARLVELGKREYITDLDSLVLHLSELKQARISILKGRSRGKPAVKKELNRLHEIEKKLSKILTTEQQGVIKNIVKNSEAIKGRRQRHLQEEEVILSGLTKKFMRLKGITSLRLQRATNARFDRMVKAKESQAKARKMRKKAEINYAKLSPRIKKMRDEMAIFKKNIRKDINEGRAIPESYLNNPNFADIIKLARKEGKEIKTFGEVKEGTISDAAAESLNKITPIGEKGVKPEMPKISPALSDSGTKVFDLVMKPLRHLKKSELKNEAAQRGIIYSNNTTKPQLMKLIKEHDMLKASKDYKGMGEVISYLKKGGYVFKTKGKSREARTKQLQEYRRAVEKNYDRYVKEQEARQKAGRKEPLDRTERGTLSSKIEDAPKTKVEGEATVKGEAPKAEAKELPPEPVENDPMISMATLNKASVIAWAPIRKLFGKIPLSFTAEVGTLETHGALRFIAGHALQDSMARRNPVTGAYMPVTFAAESKAIMNTNRAFVEAMSEYGTAEKRWFKENKASLLDRGTNAAEEAFGAEVSQSLRGTYTGTNRHVLKASKTLRKVLEYADKHMVENGITEKLFNDPNFLPRKIMPNKLIKLIKKYNMDAHKWGSTALEENLIKPAIISGYKKAGKDIDPVHADFLAQAWVRNVHKRGTLVDYNSNGFLGESSAVVLRDYLQSIEGMSEGVIKEILNKTRVSDNPSSPRFLKHRLLMDEGYTAKLVDAEGRTNTVSVTDAFDNNAKRVVWSHIRQVHGEVAWREIGIKFNEARGLSNKDYIRPATTQEMWKFIENDMGKTGRSQAEGKKAKAHLERMEAAVKGRAYGEQSDLTTMARILQKMSGSIYGGSFGLAAVAELGQPLAHSSLKAYMAHIPALKGVIKDFKNGTVSGQLQRELAWLTGIGTEGKAFREIATMFEHYPMGKAEHMSALENLAGNTQLKVLKYGGLIPIDAIQRQYAATLFVQHLLNSSLSGKAPYSVKRLYQIGLSESQADIIMGMLKKHSSYDGTGGNRLRLMNLKKWEGAEGQQAAQALQEAIYLHTQKVIHQSHTGNIPHWAQNPVMRTLFQFRFFGLGSLETQLLSNLQAADRRAAMSFTTNTFFGMLTYMSIMANKYGADEEKLKEVMTFEEIAKGSVWRSGWLANMGGLIDTLLPMFGADPLSPHSRTTNLTTSLGLSGSPTGQMLENMFGGISAVTLSAADADVDFLTQKNMRRYSNLMVGRTLPLIATAERAYLNMLPDK
tara:strand:+ start:3283 stop:8622 length:5340 start_codon:yes stop_codon:yes gene_type:complete